MRRASLLIALIGTFACSQASPTPAGSDKPAPTPAASATSDRPYLLERVGEAAVVQFYADGFNELPLKEKTLIWHLYQAAIAGRDINVAAANRFGSCSLSDIRRMSRTAT